jgi:type II secretory pathway pseudopilin PulG
MQNLTSRSPRGGYSLVELLIAMVMAAILGIGVLKVFVGTQRLSNAIAQQVDVHQNMRTAAAMLPSELRQLNAVDGDIKAMSATSITIRAMRQVGIVCTIPVMGATLTGRTLRLRRPLYSSPRDFAVGDSLYVWNEGDPYTRLDDGWLPGRVTAIGTLACTDGTNGHSLTVDFVSPVLVPQVNVVGGVPLGAPVRGFETVTYSLVQAADTRWYVNLTTTNGSGTTGPTPIIGPLTGNTGLAFTYYNSAGAVTALPAQVAQIGITLREQSVRKVHRAGGVGFTTDSLTTRVTLRNNPRY